MKEITIDNIKFNLDKIENINKKKELKILIDKTVFRCVETISNNLYKFYIFISIDSLIHQ